MGPRTYSGQARRLIKRLKGFNRVSFEEWYEEHINIAGGGHVLQYLEHKAVLEQEKKEGGV